MDPTGAREEGSVAFLRAHTSPPVHFLSTETGPGGRKRFLPVHFLSSEKIAARSAGKSDTRGGLVPVSER